MQNNNNNSKERGKLISIIIHSIEYKKKENHRCIDDYIWFNASSSSKFMPKGKFASLLFFWYSYLTHTHTHAHEIHESSGLFSFVVIVVIIILLYKKKKLTKRSTNKHFVFLKRIWYFSFHIENFIIFDIVIIKNRRWTYTKKKQRAAINGKVQQKKTKVNDDGE